MSVTYKTQITFSLFQISRWYRRIRYITVSLRCDELSKIRGKFSLFTFSFLHEDYTRSISRTSTTKIQIAFNESEVSDIIQILWFTFHIIICNPEIITYAYLYKKNVSGKFSEFMLQLHFTINYENTCTIEVLLIVREK